MRGVFAVWMVVCCVAWGEAVSPDSVEWVCEHHADRVTALLAALDLGRSDMAGVRHGAEAGDLAAACLALLEHYQRGASAEWLRDPGPSSTGTETADAALRDTFTFYEVTGTVPRTPDGGLDWNYLGPNNDREWALALNRHFHLNAWLDAFLATRNDSYVRAYDASVRDWILNNPYPGRENVTLPWRGLEAHFRATHWARGFYALQGEPAFSPATRLLMLTSLPDHAHYLKNFHKPTSNWIVMELNGLATIAACWPEFRESPQWMDYAADQLTGQLTGQVYPDGAQHELTSHYHRVTVESFERFAATARYAGKELSPGFQRTIAGMWDYLAGTMQADGYGLLNNDSDRDHTAPVLRAKADEYDRPDWMYIATNGAAGTAPEGLPSRFYPWAGHVVMRNGWDANAQWAFFDIGPLGTGHYHYDKLHLSIAAGGRDLLVDGGRYTYVGGEWRKFFTHSASHNVLLVDGHGQAPSPKLGSAPLDDRMVSTKRYDLAWGTFDSGYLDVGDDVRHTRVVVYVRGRYWIVVDQVDVAAAHRIEALWHFHPGCAVTVADGIAASTEAGQTNLAIVPSGADQWTVSTVRGQEAPEIQGWWSREYNVKEPATVAMYERQVTGPAVWAWLMVPYTDTLGPATLTLEQPVPGRVTLDVDVDGSHERIALTLPPAVSLEFR